MQALFCHMNKTQLTEEKIIINTEDSDLQQKKQRVDEIKCSVSANSVFNSAKHESALEQQSSFAAIEMQNQNDMIITSKEIVSETSDITFTSDSAQILRNLLKQFSSHV